MAGSFPLLRVHLCLFVVNAFKNLLPLMDTN